MDTSPDLALIPRSLLDDDPGFRQLQEAGATANYYASLSLLEDYQQRLAASTKARQYDALQLLANYFAQSGLLVEQTQEATLAKAQALYSDISTWRGLTWGMVAGFKRWMERHGMAIGSINVHLATIRAYCHIAKQAGMLTADEYASILLVKGYRQQEGKNVDTVRQVTRIGNKKAASIVLSSEQVAQLKALQPDTSQGRRDLVLLCFLLDQGLRCSELAILPVSAIDMQAKQFRLKRPKVNKVQLHDMTNDTYQALLRYLEIDKPQETLLLGSTIDGRTLTGRMSPRAIHKRVKRLGKRIGVPTLSPHDCRHTWATRAARGKTNPFVLQEAGGWTSLQTPRRYIEENAIANEGLVLA